MPWHCLHAHTPEKGRNKNVLSTPQTRNVHQQMFCLSPSPVLFLVNLGGGGAGSGGGGKQSLL